MNFRPKVYTFYEPINKWEPDRKLVDLWVKNWHSHGFDPIVLSSNEAKQNKSYQEFTETISECFEKIMGRDIIIPSNPWSYYVFYTFVRFLGYANINVDQPILIMDYDVYNVDYELSEHKKLGNNLTFHVENCPCLVSGTPKKIQEMCNAISQTCKNYSSELKVEFEDSPYAAFHDMAFMHCLKNSKDKTLNNILKDMNISFTSINDSILTKHMIHSSNMEVEKYCSDNNVDTKTLSQEDKINIRMSSAISAIQKLKQNDIR